MYSVSFIVTNVIIVVIVDYVTSYITFYAIVPIISSPCYRQINVFKFSSTSECSSDSDSRGSDQCLSKKVHT